MNDARHLAAEIAALKRAVRDLQVVGRIGGSSTDEGPIVIEDEDGNTKVVIGDQGDGGFGIGHANGNLPVAPTTPVVDPGPGTLSVTWDGLSADGSAWLSDFSYVEVHLSTVSGFVPDLYTRHATLNGAGSVNLRKVTGTTYYVALVGVNTSGYRGAKSAEVAATPDAVVSQTEIDQINTDVAAAQTAADNAQTTATNAQTTADAANTTATNAQTTATNAQTAAANAQSTADAANTAANNIGPTQITDDAIQTRHITALAITAAEIAAGAVVAGKIAANAVEAGTIAAGAVTAGTIAANAVTAGTIAAGAVVAGKIGAGAVEAGTIAAGAIATNDLAAGAVTAAKIAALTITGDKIAANAITADKIAVGTITADRIAADAITADKIAAGALDGITITGAYIRTGVSPNTRIDINSPGNQNMIAFYNLNTSWDPGLIWSTYSDNTGIGGTIDSALNMQGPKPTGSAEGPPYLSLTSTSAGGRYATISTDRVNFTADTFYLQSTAGSVDWHITGTHVMQFRDDGSGYFFSFDFSNIGSLILHAFDNGTAMNFVIRGRDITFRSRGLNDILVTDVGQGGFYMNVGGSGCLAWGTSGGAAILKSVAIDNSTYRAMWASDFHVPSDVRVKANLAPVTGAADLLKRVPVYDYDTPHGALDLPRRTRGVLAQDLAAVLPEAVQEVDDHGSADNLGVGLYALLATAIAAVQELTVRVEQLEGK